MASSFILEWRIPKNISKHIIIIPATATIGAQIFTFEVVLVVFDPSDVLVVVELTVVAEVVELIVVSEVVVSFAKMGIEFVFTEIAGLIVVVVLVAIFVVDGLWVDVDAFNDVFLGFVVVVDIDEVVFDVVDNDGVFSDVDIDVVFLGGFDVVPGIFDDVNNDDVVLGVVAVINVVDWFVDVDEFVFSVVDNNDVVFDVADVGNVFVDIEDVVFGVVDNSVVVNNVLIVVTGWHRFLICWLYHS